jgi:DnaJ domain
MTTNDSVLDPRAVLSVSQFASLADIRARYLQLVRDNPPDRDPAKFRKIHRAYQMLCDPLEQARALLEPPKSVQTLSEVCDAAEQQKPKMSRLTILALGNTK